MDLNLKHGALHLHSYNDADGQLYVDIIDAKNPNSRLSLIGYRITQVTIEPVDKVADLISTSPNPGGSAYAPPFDFLYANPAFPYVHPATGNLPEAMARQQQQAPELDPKDIPSNPAEHKPRRVRKSEFDGQYIAITRQGRDNPRGRHKAGVGRMLLDAVRSAGTMSWEAYRDLASPGDAGRNLRHDIRFGNVRMIKQEKK